MAYLRTKKKRKALWPVTVYVDDREKKPFKLDNHYFKVERKRLAVGDYTFKGFEHKVVIEKKSGVGEIIQNISGKYRPRFRLFLGRLSKMPIKFMLVGGCLEDMYEIFARNKKIRVTPHGVLYWISTIMTEYEIPVLFLGNDRDTKKEMVNTFFIKVVENML